MKRIAALLIVLALLCPLRLSAQELDLELDPVERELMMEPRPLPAEQAPPVIEEKGKSSWLYILLGVGVLGLAAGGGGGGGGDTPSDGSMTVSW